MELLNDWHDYWRAVNAVVCAISVFLLVSRFVKHRESYNTKTTDIWYAFVAWTTTGLISSLEGIWQDGDLGIRVLCVSIGGVVTLIALLRKGSWGNPDA